jgi:cytochrome c peroxidase
MKCAIVIAIVIIACMATLASFCDPEPANIAALGERLFFDPILSKDRTVSCATCHRPEYAFADTSALSKGVGGATGVRNTPSAMNVRLQHSFFWDGRASSLEDQVLAPIENPAEMNLPLDEALQRLQENTRCHGLFKNIFNTKPNRTSLAEALAAFMRTFETSDSPFDEWKFLDDPAAVRDAVKEGFAVFNGKGKCIQCHFGADFTTNEFRNIGLFNSKNLNDSGRYVVSRRKEDIGRFKVGSLRNVAVTAPYMHNGMFGTLREVIEFYNDPAKVVPDAINQDSLLQKPLGLTASEKSALEAFLRSLTDKRFKVPASIDTLN